MAWNTNLTQWLSGGTRNRELDETHALFAQTEAAWNAGPLKEDPAFNIAVEVLRVATRQSGRSPADSIVNGIGAATSEFLLADGIRDIDPIWSLIETDATVAVNFRQLMRERMRWAAEYDRYLGITTRTFGEAYARLFDALPESCFGEWRPEDGLFEVPLIELMEHPAEVIEKLVLAPYDPEALKLDLFETLRQVFENHLRIASGLHPTADLFANEHRLVLPTRHKSRDGRELLDLYLSGTYFKDALETPVPFEVPEASRFEHAHIVGGTGHGKTQLMQRMIHADLLKAQQDGRCVIVIDSQGDMLNRLVRLDLFSPDHPDSLADRLIVIDPADVEFPASLNLFDAKLERLADYRPVDRERVLNGVVELYETFFGALLGAELTQKQGVVFKYLARLMLAIPGSTIHTLMQVMEDGRPFKPQMDALEGSARYFFQTEFFQPSFSATKKQILRRLWGVLATPTFERMFAQTRNTLDLFQAMQDGKIILINTAKDLLKAEGSQLFGRFFIAMLAQATLERSTVELDERTPAFVYVDEAQEYFDDTVEAILNQARKYRVSLTVAHQALDQLSSRLRAVLHANTAMKCAGGVSARDARAFAEELHTTPEFIEGMKRGQGKTEFAVWIRQQTPRALRLAVPLGHVERQPTLSEEDYDELIARNRRRYCGTLADVPTLEFRAPEQPSERPVPHPPVPPQETAAPSVEVPAPESEATPTPQAVEPSIQAARPPPRAPTPTESGKGGPKHRYLQQLVKELGEQHGFRGVVEAPLPGGGQADVLLTRDGLAVPFEVSITTPAEWELANVRKCLAAGHERVVLVLAKSKRTEARYRETILAGLTEDERTRLTVLSPEDIPDFIASLGPPPEPTETVVKGYKVRVSHTAVSPEDAKARRESLAKLVARSLDRPG